MTKKAKTESKTKFQAALEKLNWCELSDEQHYMIAARQLAELIETNGASAEMEAPRKDGTARLLNLGDVSENTIDFVAETLGIERVHVMVMWHVGAGRIPLCQGTLFDWMDAFEMKRPAETEVLA